MQAAHPAHDFPSEVFVRPPGPWPKRLFQSLSLSPQAVLSSGAEPFRERLACWELRNLNDSSKFAQKKAVTIQCRFSFPRQSVADSLQGETLAFALACADIVVEAASYFVAIATGSAYVERFACKKFEEKGRRTQAVDTSGCDFRKRLGICRIDSSRQPVCCVFAFVVSSLC